MSFLHGRTEPASNGTISPLASRSRTASSRASNGRMRDGVLNETLFRSLSHTPVVLASWRKDYNEERPHSKLGWMTPCTYAAAFSGTAGQMRASWRVTRPVVSPERWSTTTRWPRKLDVLLTTRPAGEAGPARAPRGRGCVR